MLAHRSHNIVSWELLPHIDPSDDSVDVIKNANSLMNTSNVCVQQQLRHEDSNDSDYADSDN